MSASVHVEDTEHLKCTFNKASVLCATMNELDKLLLTIIRVSFGPGFILASRVPGEFEITGVKLC